MKFEHIALAGLVLLALASSQKNNNGVSQVSPTHAKVGQSPKRTSTVATGAGTVKYSELFSPGQSWLPEGSLSQGAGQTIQYWLDRVSGSTVDPWAYGNPKYGSAAWFSKLVPVYG